MTSKKPWQWVAMGCGGIVVLVLAIAAFVAFLYWPKLTAVYREAKTSVSELTHVSSALQSTYGGHVALGASRRSGVEGTTLHITLTNPTFLARGDPGDEAIKSTAFEVAVFVRRTLTTQQWYANYEVDLVRDGEGSITASQSWSYTFKASELPAAKTKHQ